MLKATCEIPPAPPGSLRDRDDRYYRLLAGGAKTRLLEGFLDLQLPELLGKRGEMTAREICQSRALHPHRGWKFLHLLAMVGLLQESGGDHGRDDARFSLSEEAKEYFGADGSEGYYFRDLLNFWRAVAVLPFVDVLRGLPLPAAVRWPPPGLVEAEHLETWMRVTAEGAIANLLSSGALEGARRLLDVGGGDGTIGCALVKRYPDLAVTVFNLPASAFLARRRINDLQCGDQVGVHEGDFLREELPGGYDRVLFSRVLTDWTPEVCQMLFEKSARALEPGGRLVINEALVDGNLDYALSWEFRYLFYDTFGRVLFKPLTVYRDLLCQAGFEIVKFTPMSADAFYSVIEAERR
jgi:precorrin-6B methylase 2